MRTKFFPAREILTPTTTTKTRTTRRKQKYSNDRKKETNQINCLDIFYKFSNFLTPRCCCWGCFSPHLLSILLIIKFNVSFFLLCLLHHHLASFSQSACLSWQQAIL